MLKTYLIETLVGLCVAFMVLYPPQVGVFVFVATLSLIIGLKLIEHKESPDVLKLKDEVRDIKNKVEQLILGRR